MLGQHPFGAAAAAFSALSQDLSALSQDLSALSQDLAALSQAAGFAALEHALPGQPACAVSAAVTRRNGMISVFITIGF